ncbi:MAG: hypothetical protein JNL70_08985 [Saprospiraceae bacterium]|nr:hypothetical protein [Saprospiraceae bacterium]
MKTQEAQSLLTKFFYKDNHLHFQILIQAESELVLFGEYNDYGLYKNAFDLIQQKIKNGTRIIHLLEKKLNEEKLFVKVA